MGTTRYGKKVRDWNHRATHYPGVDPGTFRCGQHTRNKGKTDHLNITENIDEVDCTLCIQRIKNDVVVGYDDGMNPITTPARARKGKKMSYDYDISDPTPEAIERAEALGLMLKQEVYDQWETPLEYRR